MATDGTVVFCDPRIRRGKAIRFVVGAVGCFYIVCEMSLRPTSLVHAYEVFMVLVGIFCLVGAARSLRGGITLDDEGVTVRTTFSTRSWRWEELRHAETRDRTSLRSTTSSLGISRNQRRTQILPTLRLASGKDVELHGLRLVLPGDDLRNWVDDAMHAIDRRLIERRGDGSPTRR